MPATHRTAARLAISAAALLVSVAVLDRPAAAETLVIAATESPGGFDNDILTAKLIDIMPQIYEGLTRHPYVKAANGQTVFDASKLESHVAESWTSSDGGKVFVFKLRQGIKSPFGNELTADDVVWAYDKAFAIKRSGFFMAKLSHDINTVEKLSKYEVKFTLNQPIQTFLRGITLYNPATYDTVEVKKNATAEDPFASKWLAGHTAGFGPYHLESHKPGEETIFVTNKNYFGPKPYYDRIVYKAVPSPANRAALIRTGQVQWTEELTFTQLEELRKDPRVKVESYYGEAPITVRMNPTFKPFDDIRIRKAILYATDYDAINRAVFGGQATRAYSDIPISVVPDLKTYPYDTDINKAKALLTEAGYPNGIEIPLEYGTRYWWEEQIAVQMKAALAKAGITVSPKRIQDSEMWDRARADKDTLAFSSQQVIPFVADIGFTMHLNYHTRGLDHPTRMNRNKAYDAIVDAIKVEQDPAKTRELMMQGQKMFMDDAVWVILHYPGIHVAMHPCVTGWVRQVTNGPLWKDLKCEKKS